MTPGLLTYLDLPDIYLKRLGESPSKRYVAELVAISPRNETRYVLKTGEGRYCGYRAIDDRRVCWCYAK